MSEHTVDTFLARAHPWTATVSERSAMGAPLSPRDEARIRERIDEIPIFRSLRFRDFSIARGRCTCVLPRDRRYDGIFESFHGGLMLTAADSAAAVAVLTVTGPGARIATTHMAIRFLSPLRSDLEVTARVLKVGRSLVPTDVLLHDDRGRTVARSQVTYMRLSEPGR